MLPDSKWIDALSLPAKVIGGLFAFFVLSLLIDWKFTPLIAPPAWGYFVLGAILTGCLFIASMASLLFSEFQEGRKLGIIAKRRLAIKEERNREREEAEKNYIKNLDYLSVEELRYISEALRSGSPSFKAFVHNADISNMMARGLVATPGGTHHQDHYPFFFPGFIWREMLLRKDDLIGKHDENERHAKEARRRP